MSQYPSPYQTPPGYPYSPMGYMPPPDLGRPARNAGLLMIIVGIFTALFAGCFFAVGTMFADPSGLLPEQRQQIEEMKEQTQSKYHADAGLLLKVASGVIGIPAFCIVLLGLFVRKGKMWAIILGIVVTAGMLLLILASIANSLLTAPGDVHAIQGVCVLAIPTALLGLQMWWLVRAVTSVGPLKVFNEHQQAYQWHMAQQAAAQQQYYHQMYQQQGYNYPATPPPPPPPPPPQTGDNHGSSTQG